MILHRPCLEKNLESKRFRKKKSKHKVVVWRMAFNSPSES